MEPSNIETNGMEDSELFREVYLIEGLKCTP